MDPESPQHTGIRIGPAGWSYPDWRGIFYPKPRPRGFQELEYVAQFFDIAEVNTTFYQPLRAEWAKKWLVQVAHNKDFKFTAKLWRGFTHERSATPEDEKAFKQGILPLAEEGSLGTLLLQFPWSFRNTPENRDYLAKLVQQFADYPLVVEVRHASWDTPEVLDWLAELRVGICNVDQPVIGKSLAPASRLTGTVGYVRLHGRNAEHWFRENAYPGQRYDYLYNLDELQVWAQRIKMMAKDADVVYIITNNHPKAKGVVNALQLTNLVTGKPVRVPETLAERYAELKKINSSGSTHVNALAFPSLFEGVP